MYGHPLWNKNINTTFTDCDTNRLLYRYLILRKETVVYDNLSSLFCAD